MLKKLCLAAVIALARPTAPRRAGILATQLLGRQRCRQRPPWRHAPRRSERGTPWRYRPVSSGRCRVAVVVSAKRPFVGRLQAHIPLERIRHRRRHQDGRYFLATGGPRPCYV